MKKLYVVMVSWDKGVSWMPYLREGSGVFAYEYKRMANKTKEKCYQELRDESRKRGLKPIPRKYFKVVEFSQTEEIK